jgi:hypothetical protein
MGSAVVLFGYAMVLGVTFFFLPSFVLPEPVEAKKRLWWPQKHA